MRNPHGWHANVGLLNKADCSHFKGTDRGRVRMEMKMFARFNNSFGRAFAQFGSAIRVSAAVRNHRVPAARDLETLGIDVEQFRRIRG